MEEPVKMSQVNQQLAKLAEMLAQIDLSKDLSVEQIKKMGEEPIRTAEKLTTDSSYGPKSLNATITAFEAGKDKVAEYDEKAEEAKVNDLVGKGQFDQARDLNKKREARTKVKEDITSKYEDLTRRREVMYKYMREYDPQELEDRQNKRISQNEQKMEENDKFIQDVQTLKNSEIKENLDNIQRISAFAAMIVEIDKISRDIKELEKKKKDYPEFEVQIDGQLNNKRNKLSEKCKEFNGNKMGIVISDSKAIGPATIQNAKKELGTKATAQKTEILNKIQGMDDNIFQTRGFKATIGKELDKTEPEKISERLNELAKDKEIENLNLKLKNKRTKADIEDLKLAEDKIKEAGEKKDRLNEEEIKEEDIDDRLKEDEETALMLQQTRKDYNDNLYRSYLESKGKEAKGFHPVAWIKSRFGKESREGWKNQQKEIAKRREEAEDNLRAEKVEKVERDTARYEKALQGSKDRRIAFQKSVFAQVMNADEKQLQEMEKNAEEEEYGDVLNEAYNAAEATKSKKVDKSDEGR